MFHYWRSPLNNVSIWLGFAASLGLVWSAFCQLDAFSLNFYQALLFRGFNITLVCICASIYPLFKAVAKTVQQYGRKHNTRAARIKDSRSTPSQRTTSVQFGKPNLFWTLPISTQKPNQRQGLHHHLHVQPSVTGKKGVWYHKVSVHHCLTIADLIPDTLALSSHSLLKLLPSEIPSLESHVLGFD